MLHSFGKQTYKMELLARGKIYDVFHISLLEQDTIKKWQMNKFSVLEFEVGDDKKYKIEAI